MEAVAGKVTALQLGRDAYLYVRQSTLAQVVNNTESTQRQYDLRGRAVALGWPADRVHVIDIDQGRSGASAADRVGFQHLVAEVSLGNAGIVLGLECSRLARNNADWHRLLEICALNSTLICDEDGLYDPSSFNDRMLLGLKGALSEAELHLLRARMRGGLLAKARRGELAVALPIGLVYDHLGHVVLDPDTGVRQAVQLLFTVFARSGSARAVVKAFTEQGLPFPGRHHGGPQHGGLHWKTLTHNQVLKVLHNPRYAGAFCYGRQRHFKNSQGLTRTLDKPREQWIALIPDAHPGYVTFAQFEANLAQLTANAAARGDDRRTGPAREGPALLQGLVVCGRCGRRMTVRYHARNDGVLRPDYVCQVAGIANVQPICQFMPGSAVDAAVADLVLRNLTPLAVHAALAVTEELTQRGEQADRIRAGHVARAQHLADAARHRYLAVDPTNRLVADTLEAEWNNALRDLATNRAEYEKAKKDDPGVPDDQQRAQILALTADLPALWHNPATPVRERKRLLRLLVDDVTLVKHPDHISVGVRLRGGQHHTLSVERRLDARHGTTAPGPALAAITELVGDHTYGQIADILNSRGLTSGNGTPFTDDSVRYHCYRYHLPSLRRHLRDQGWLTQDEMAQVHGVHPFTIADWCKHGLLQARVVEGRGTRLFPPGQPRPSRQQVTLARAHGRSHHQQLLDSGLQTRHQLAEHFGVHALTVRNWHQLGLLTAEQSDVRDTWLFHPGQVRPTPAQVTAARSKGHRPNTANPCGETL
jgi:DNA invertase Pin-like site-specific DNA recombinase/DNA-binding transcriptional MerR regulator